MFGHVVATSDTQSTKARLTFQDAQRLRVMVNDRVQHHKPLQYILGTQPFADLDIVTHPPTLIPRWETEEWVYRLLGYVKQQRLDGQRLRILDLCTGSGCIALALARNLQPNSADISAVDVSESALELSRLNAKILAPQLYNPVTISRMDVLKANSFSVDDNHPFDLIVSNPPYVTHAEYADLTPDVKVWEDRGALVAENDGMAFHLHIANIIGKRGALSRRLHWPRLVMEIGGSHQVDTITKALQDNGLPDVQVWKDLAGKDRAIAAG